MHSIVWSILFRVTGVPRFLLLLTGAMLYEDI